jgi:hypothetical protein
MACGWLWIATPGCSGCNDNYVDPVYHITIVEDPSGDPICDAVVSSPGIGLASVSGCTYRMKIPSQGDSITITVERDDYVTSTKDLSTDYETDRCGHAEPRDVEVRIKKAT